MTRFSPIVPHFDPSGDPTGLPQPSLGIGVQCRGKEGHEDRGGGGVRRKPNLRSGGGVV